MGVRREIAGPSLLELVPEITPPDFGADPDVFWPNSEPL